MLHHRRMRDVEKFANARSSGHDHSTTSATYPHGKITSLTKPSLLPSGAVSARHSGQCHCPCGDWLELVCQHPRGKSRWIGNLGNGILVLVEYPFLGSELTASEHRHDMPPLRASPTFARFSIKGLRSLQVGLSHRHVVIKETTAVAQLAAVRETGKDAWV